MPAAKSPFSKHELKEIKERLVEERAQLERQFTDIEQTSFGGNKPETPGEVTFDEEHADADAGTATFERERDLSLSNNIRDLMDKIDHALQRIDAGTYGLCSRCGKPVEKARIKALPYAALCIKDAQAEARDR